MSGPNGVSYREVPCIHLGIYNCYVRVVFPLYSLVCVATCTHVMLSDTPMHIIHANAYHTN